MDRIFHKTTNVFDVVKIAKHEPHMYGPNGELLRTLDDIEDDAVRRASVLSNPAKRAAQNRAEHAENTDQPEKMSDTNSSEDK